MHYVKLCAPRKLCRERQRVSGGLREIDSDDDSLGRVNLLIHVHRSPSLCTRRGSVVCIIARNEPAQGLPSRATGTGGNVAIRFHATRMAVLGREGPDEAESCGAFTLRVGDAAKMLRTASARAELRDVALTLEAGGPLWSPGDIRL